MTDLIIVIAGLILLILVIAIANLRIVPQSKAYVMERLGVYSRTWYTGLHIKWPFIERAAKIIDLKEQVMKVSTTDVPEYYKGIISHDVSHTARRMGDPNQVEGSHDKTSGKTAGNLTWAFDGSSVYRPDLGMRSDVVITRDNVRMIVDVAVFYQVTDCKLFAYGHANPLHAIEVLTDTMLRNIVAELEFDQAIVSRDLVNAKMRTLLDEATDAWGVKVNRVEIQNIMPFDSRILQAMEKQMVAERSRREAIIISEGKRKSAILEAEGEKQATILKAEGEKQAVILAAEAQREKMICEAEGEAESILQVQQATAEGIKMVNAAAPTKEVVALESLKSFEKVADGQATKIIIPSEIQSLAGLASSASELFKA